MKQVKIQVLIIEPMRLPRVATIKNTLAELQQSVGGFIEVIAPFNDTAAVICNEEGKILGLPLNRLIGNDIICGNFIIAGADVAGGEFVSLTDSQIQEYQRMFSMIEIFITSNAPARSHLTEETGGTE